MRNLLPILLSLFSSPPLLNLPYTNLGMHAFIPKLFPSMQGILFCGRSNLNFGKKKKSFKVEFDHVAIQLQIQVLETCYTSYAKNLKGS